MKTLTASDRATLVRLASSLPKGDETRRAILAGLKKAEEGEPNPKEALAADFAALKAAQEEVIRIGKMTPFGQWYKGDHGAAVKKVSSLANSLKKRVLSEFKGVAAAKPLLEALRAFDPRNDMGSFSDVRAFFK